MLGRVLPGLLLQEAGVGVTASSAPLNTCMCVSELDRTQPAPSEPLCGNSRPWTRPLLPFAFQERWFSRSLQHLGGQVDLD